MLYFFGYRYIYQLITPYIRILDFDWLIADVFFCIFIFRPVKISANIVFQFYKGHA